MGRFALGHNEGLWECFKRTRKLEGDVKDITSLPLASGATRTSESAFWARWADSLAMIRERHPTVVAAIVGSLERSVDIPPTLALVARARHHLSGVEGFEPPSWEALVQGTRPPEREPDHLNQEEQGLDGNTKRRQGQNCSSEAASWPLWPSTSRPCSGGPLAGTPFAAAPSTWLTRVDSHLVRVLLSRRLLSSRLCRCRRLWPPSRCVFESGGSWDGGGFQWRVWQPASAEKEGPEWQPISWSEIWISGRPMSLTAGGLKWLPTGCLCLEPAFGRRRRWGGPHHPGRGERGPPSGFERVTVVAVLFSILHYLTDSFRSKTKLCSLCSPPSPSALPPPSPALPPPRSSPLSPLLSPPPLSYSPFLSPPCWKSAERWVGIEGKSTREQGHPSTVVTSERSPHDQTMRALGSHVACTS